ncbi:Uncharacterized protein M6B38_216630 [Iris pallida]|uniref:Uncharacterized protein n=1 Tax=Iris pallida TaxID=29817 RepID=A0AAX6E020_IRIPA|nr:Uncharacterized protein M6B38_216630 [Iris pallida]
MTRRCSHCSNNGHNTRTCPSRGVKLFGVRLDGSIRKSASMGNLVHYSVSNAGGSSPDGADGGGSPAVEKEKEKEKEREREGGYASEDFTKGRERKKGVAWTEEEHKKFLLGLRNLGKGDWRGIARNYVGSRTPTQVASHAQKYFIRQSNTNRRKKRSSLFDIVPDEFGDAQAFPIGIEEPEAQGIIQLPAPASVDGLECESMAFSLNERKARPPLPKPENMQYPYPVMLPAFYPAYYPIPLPFLRGYSVETMENKTHEVFKPTPLHSNVPTRSDQLVGMSTLSLRESVGEGSSSTVFNLLGGSERHSAFHPNIQPTAGSKISSGSSPIHAI